MKTKLIFLLIALLLISGCIEEDPSCRKGINKECDCNIPEDITEWYIEFLPQDKCNCHWDTPYLNDKGYYDINTTYIGGNTHYEEICYG